MINSQREQGRGGRIGLRRKATKQIARSNLSRNNPPLTHTHTHSPWELMSQAANAPPQLQSILFMLYCRSFCSQGALRIAPPPRIQLSELGPEHRCG